MLVFFGGNDRQETSSHVKDDIDDVKSNRAQVEWIKSLFMEIECLLLY